MCCGGAATSSTDHLIGATRPACPELAAYKLKTPQTRLGSGTLHLNILPRSLLAPKVLASFRAMEWHERAITLRTIDQCYVSLTDFAGFSSLCCWTSTATGPSFTRSLPISLPPANPDSELPVAAALYAEMMGSKEVIQF